MKATAVPLLVVALVSGARGALKRQPAEPVDEKYQVREPVKEPLCSGITCPAVEGNPPFKTAAPEETGTCCPMCWGDIKVPEDRSWAEGLTGGIGMNNNADPILCRDVVCLPLDCPEYDQGFDGRCCTKCKSSLETTSLADRQKGMKDEYG